MPYKDPERQKEAMRAIMREYRAREKPKRIKKENRLSYLESEVTRLQKSLEVAQSGSAMP